METVKVFDENAEEYDRWYDENKRAYQAELQTVRRFIPQEGRGLEIGVGTGRFAGPLGVDVGIDPAAGMLDIARERGVDVREGVGEDLPFDDESFDYVLMVAVDPFVDNLEAVLREAHRVLKRRGTIIVGFIDLASPLGKVQEANKNDDKFYKVASLHSADEMLAKLRGTGFDTLRPAQTLLGEDVLPLVERDSLADDIEIDNSAYEVHDGYGEGSFVVISGQKKYTVQVD